MSGLRSDVIYRVVESPTSFHYVTVEHGHPRYYGTLKQARRAPGKADAEVVVVSVEVYEAMRRAPERDPRTSTMAIATEARVTRAEVTRLLNDIGHIMSRRGKRVRLLPVEREAVVATLRQR